MTIASQIKKQDKKPATILIEAHEDDKFGEANLTTRFLRQRENRLDRQTLSLAQALIKAGFKVTDPRLAVIEEIVSFNREFEINELAERLAQRPDFKPGIASVFRSVKLLNDLGLLQRVHSGDGCHRYGLVHGHNHQIVCRCCERTFEFEGCDFSVLTDFLENPDWLQAGKDTGSNFMACARNVAEPYR